MIVWRMRENYHNCSVLCMTGVHNDTHTLEQFLKMIVGLHVVFVHLFRFSILCVFWVCLDYFNLPPGITSVTAICFCPVLSLYPSVQALISRQWISATP